MSCLGIRLHQIAQNIEYCFIIVKYEKLLYIF